MIPLCLSTGRLVSVKQSIKTPCYALTALSLLHLFTLNIINISFESKQSFCHRLAWVTAWMCSLKMSCKLRAVNCLAYKMGFALMVEKGYYIKSTCAGWRSLVMCHSGWRFICRAILPSSVLKEFTFRLSWGKI